MYGFAFLGILGFGGYGGLLRMTRRRRVHLSTEQPYRARPKAGEVDPGGALKLGPSGAYFEEISGVLLGPASAALGPAP